MGSYEYPRVPMPAFAKIGKGFVYMLKRSSPYSDVNFAKGIVHIGHLDEESGELIVDCWGYVVFVDREADGPAFKPLRETARLMGYGAYLEKTLGKLDEEKKAKKKKEEEEARRKREDPFRLREDFRMHPIGMVCDTFFEETKTREALVEAFGEEDALRAEVIAGTYMRYGPIMMDFEGVSGTCTLQGFEPVLSKDTTWQLCCRLAANRDAFFHAMRSACPDAPLTLVRLRPRMEIIGSDGLPWEYAYTAYFSRDCVQFLHEVMAVIDRRSRMILGVIPAEVGKVSALDAPLDEILAPYAQENLDGAGLLLDSSDYFLQAKDYQAMRPQRQLTIGLQFNKGLYQKAKSLEKLDPEEGWTGLPGNVAMMMDYTYDGLEGHLLLGLSKKNRESIRANAKTRFANLKKRLMRLHPEDIPLAYGGRYFRVEEKDDYVGWTLVQNKVMIDAYKEFAGYYAIFTTDLNKTADELVLDSYELQFIQDYYVEAQCRTWEWVGFRDDYQEVMDGMLLPMILRENIEMFWMKRLLGSKVYEEHHGSVHELFRCLENITVRNKNQTLDVQYSHDYFDTRDGKLEDVLPAFGFTEQNAKDYARRILDTPGYFHEKEEKIREEEGEDASWW